MYVGQVGKQDGLGKQEYGAQACSGEQLVTVTRIGMLLHDPVDLDRGICPDKIIGPPVSRICVGRV